MLRAFFLALLLTMCAPSPAGSRGLHEFGTWSDLATAILALDPGAFGYRREVPPLPLPGPPKYWKPIMYLEEDGESCEDMPFFNPENGRLGKLCQKFGPL